MARAACLPRQDTTPTGTSQEMGGRKGRGFTASSLPAGLAGGPPENHQTSTGRQAAAARR